VQQPVCKSSVHQVTLRQVDAQMKGNSMALIGYARVSTGDQTLDLQKDALTAAGCIDIYEEYASGARVQRPELAAALRTCRPGDTLVIWKLDRLGRNTKHLIEIAEDLGQRGIGLKTLTGFELDTTTAHGKLMLQLFAALAEYERALIQERILAGIAAARARGRKGGRRPKLSPEQQQHAAMMAQSKMSITAIAKTLQCSRHTIYAALAQVGAGVAAS
jgi:DNA invertase Pin-like site-specific DNA recombinase